MNPTSMIDVHKDLQRINNHLYAITQLGTGNHEGMLCGDDVALLLEPVADRLCHLLEQTRPQPETLTPTPPTATL